MPSFKSPIFDKGLLEIRIQDGEACIYGTAKGLSVLADLCTQLATQSKSELTDHYHLSDYELLTSNSLPVVLAVFLDE